LFVISEKKILSLVSFVSIMVSIFVELSFRISYCTGKIKPYKDIFAAVLIAHLSNITTRDWVGKTDHKINEFLRTKWSQIAGKD
jgi:ABC-type uncharacterized transport system fused permease/ATPase subunit